MNDALVVVAEVLVASFVLAWIYVYVKRRGKGR